MSQGRPGGLVALAVFNFLVGGYNALRALGLAALLSFGDRILEEASPEEREVLAMFLERQGTILSLCLLYVVQAGLLVAAGIGYLKLRRFLGRGLGNAYGVLGLGAAIVIALALPTEAGGGFSIGTMIELVYPLVTLLLLNLVFREDLVR
jgi:hypothetical protein